MLSLNICKAIYNLKQLACLFETVVVAFFFLLFSRIIWIWAKRDEGLKKKRRENKWMQRCLLVSIWIFSAFVYMCYVCRANDEDNDGFCIVEYANIWQRHFHNTFHANHSLSNEYPINAFLWHAHAHLNDVTPFTISIYSTNLHSTKRNSICKMNEMELKRKTLKLGSNELKIWNLIMTSFMDGTMENEERTNTNQKRSALIKGLCVTHWHESICWILSFHFLLSSCCWSNNVRMMP